MKKKPLLKPEDFNEFYERRLQEASDALGKVRVAEARSKVGLDGRISSKTDLKGLVQLNVRVPLDIKTQVLEERARRKASGSKQADVGDIVSEALKEFLNKPRS